ncbi:hypothetical protein M5W74_16180, partial [Paenibacillus larvae]|nr:hypothetical protein [Paenibacillus larvae]
HPHLSILDLFLIRQMVPFSLPRFAKNIDSTYIEKHNDVFQKTDETGWNYNVTTSEEVFNDIRQFYIPKCYNKQREYVETDNLQDFVCHTSPYCVIDAIEFFEKYNQNTDFGA